METTLGDIFIYNGKLFHSGSENRSNQVRNILSIQFVKRYITPCEDMKLQYSQLNTKDNKLSDLMTKYHSPHVNKFGVNRQWIHTTYWIILKYPNYIVKKIIIYYYKISQIIYQLFTK